MAARIIMAQIESTGAREMSGENNVDELTEQEMRVILMKQNLTERYSLEKEMEIEIYKINQKFAKKMEKIHELNKKIVNGEHPVKKEDVIEIINKYKDVKLCQSPPLQEVKEKGLKSFWLNCMKNCSEISSMIGTNDEAVLAYLIDIRTTQTSPDSPHPEYPEFKAYGLLVEYEFSENPYFTNKILYKFFELDFVIDKLFPFEFDGLTPIKVEVSIIDWLPEKNVTIRTIKKVQKHKKTKVVRTINKEEKVESFFNYFQSIQSSDLKCETSPEETKLFMDSILHSDYDLATFFHTDFIPRSVLYYLHELDQDEDDSSYDDDDDSSEEECDHCLQSSSDEGCHSRGRGAMNNRGAKDKHRPNRGQSKY